MIIVDPYLTSYGKTLNKEKAKKEVMKYMITTDVEDLSYGYKTSENTNLVFITGRNNDEKDLPIFVFPLVLEDIRNKTTIAVDLRKFCKDRIDTNILMDMFKDKANGEFYIITAVIMADFLQEEYTTYRRVFNNISGAYAVLTSNIINSCTPLSVVEKVQIEVAAAYYANLLLTPSKDYTDYRDAYIARISNIKFSIPIDKKTTRQVIESIRLEPELTVYGLIDVCKQLVTEDKKGLIESKLYISMLANMWYGINSLDLLTAAQECMPLWIAILYTTLTNLTFAKSRLTTLLEKNSKAVDSKEYIKIMSTYLKDKGVINV